MKATETEPEFRKRFAKAADENAGPQKIYTLILAEVDALLHTFNESRDEDEEIKKAHEETRKKLTDFRQEIQRSLEQLEKNSEWDVFTIAFYGETNAGKSTLIETLRILLKEPGKMKEREKFNRRQEEYNKAQAKIEECKSFVQENEEAYKKTLEDIENRSRAVSAAIQTLSGEVNSVNEEIAGLRNAAKIERKTSVSNFFKYLFGNLAAQKETRAYKNKLVQKKKEISENKQKIKALDSEKKALYKGYTYKKQKFSKPLAGLENQAKKCLDRMKSHIDGRIIGDGRSDFTRTVASFAFEAGSQKFALLDLPGIEGNEGPVLDAINAAVQKAHAVFYVTGKPTPPQTGDENGEGTLQKIKKHLGEQTEVFTVFNKRVKNPQALKEPLTDRDEDESLKNLDKTMSACLGGQYRRSLPLSAYPAFLSVANCCQNDYEAKQKKFLEHFHSSETLLKKTGVKEFASWLASSIVNDCKAKIKKVNYKKAAAVVNDTVEKIKGIHKKYFEFQKVLADTKNSADMQLDSAAGELKNRLIAEGHAAIDKFKTGLRGKIYKDIDTEINNDYFKMKLKEHADESIRSLQPVLETRFNAVLEKFQNDVSDIIKKYQKYAEELLTAYTGAGKIDTKFELKIDIKSGVNWGGLLTSVLGSVVGVILCLTNPAGWVVLAFSIAGLIVSLVKAIVGFFNHDYRKSQQRKAADENIDKWGAKIYESIEQNLKETYKPLDEGIRKIKNELAKSVSHVKSVNKTLSLAEQKFAMIASNIRTEGER
jgi:hypothetical protein